MKDVIWFLCSSKVVRILLLMASLLLSETNALKLNCEYKTGHFSQVGEQNSFYCNAKNLQVTILNEEVDGVVTSYAGGNDAVRGLYIQSQTLNFFPAGIEKVFKNLRAIQIGISKLKRITKADLRPFNELKGIWIYHNEIDTLEKDLFKFNTKLTCIYFIQNKLQHIDSKVLEPLTQLTTAYFSGNPCTNIDAHNPTKIQELKNQIAQFC